VHKATYYKQDEQLSVQESNPLTMLAIFHAAVFIMFLLVGNEKSRRA